MMMISKSRVYAECRVSVDALQQKGGYCYIFMQKKQKSHR